MWAEISHTLIVLQSDPAINPLHSRQRSGLWLSVPRSIAQESESSNRRFRNCLVKPPERHLQFIYFVIIPEAGSPQRLLYLELVSGSETRYFS